MKEARHGKKRKLTAENLKAACFHVWRQFDDSYYAGFAAQVAYFFFMSSMPTIIVVSQLLGLFDISLDFIRDWLAQYADEHVSDFIMGLFSTSSVHLTNIVLIFLALWGASALVFSLSRLMSHILTEGQYKFNFFVERIRVIPTALVTMVAIAFTLIVYVYGENLFRRFVDRFTVFRVLLALRVPIVIGLFFVMILMSYYILPRIRVPLRAVLPGAIVATAGIMIITTIYGKYIGYNSNYDILYGSVSSIIILMFWFYLISWVICLGAMFNKAWDTVTRSELLTKESMMSYLEKQKRRDMDIEKLFHGKYDKYHPDTESLAVKMSRKYVKGYDDKIKREKAAIDERERRRREAEDLYEEYFSDV